MWVNGGGRGKLRRSVFSNGQSLNELGGGEDVDC